MIRFLPAQYNLIQRPVKKLMIPKQSAWEKVRQTATSFGHIRYIQSFTRNYHGLQLRSKEYVLIDRVRGPDGEIFGPRSSALGPCSITDVKYFLVRPDLNSINKHFIIWALYLL